MYDMPGPYNSTVPMVSEGVFFVVCFFIENGNKNWPIADWCIPCNDPRNSCEMHFFASFCLVSRIDVALLSLSVMKGWRIRP